MLRSAAIPLMLIILIKLAHLLGFVSAHIFWLVIPLTIWIMLVMDDMPDFDEA